MQHQQKLKSAQRLIPQFKILILQYLIDKYQSRCHYQLKLHAFHSILFSNLIRKSSRDNPTIQLISSIINSSNSFIARQTDTFKTLNYYTHRQSSVERHGQAYKTDRQRSDLKDSNKRQNDEDLILQDSKGKSSPNAYDQQEKNKNKMEGSPALRLFQDDEKELNTKNLTNENKRSYQDSNYDHQYNYSKPNNLKYQMKKSQVELYQNSLKQSQDSNCIKSSTNNRQTNISKDEKICNKYYGISHKIGLKFIKNMVKITRLRIISSAFSLIKEKAFLQLNGQNTHRNCQMLLQQKDDYIFELQSDLSIKNDEIDQLKKTIAYYKKPLNPKSKHQRTISSHNYNDNALNSNDTLQTSFNIKRTQILKDQQAQTNVNRGGVQLRQFKLIYRVDGDSEMGNSIKIRFSRDSRDSRSVQLVENGDVDEQGEGSFKKEVIGDIF